MEEPAEFMAYRFEVKGKEGMTVRGIYHSSGGCPSRALVEVVIPVALCQGMQTSAKGHGGRQVCEHSAER